MFHSTVLLPCSPILFVLITTVAFSELCFSRSEASFIANLSSNAITSVTPFESCNNKEFVCYFEELRHVNEQSVRISLSTETFT